MPGWHGQEMLLPGFGDRGTLAECWLCLAFPRREFTPPPTDQHRTGPACRGWVGADPTPFPRRRVLGARLVSWGSCSEALQAGGFSCSSVTAHGFRGQRRGVRLGECPTSEGTREDPACLPSLGSCVLGVP